MHSVAYVFIWLDSRPQAIFMQAESYRILDLYVMKSISFIPFPAATTVFMNCIDQWIGNLSELITKQAARSSIFWYKFYKGGLVLLPSALRQDKPIVLFFTAQYTRRIRNCRKQTFQHYFHFRRALHISEENRLLQKRNIVQDNNFSLVYSSLVLSCLLLSSFLPPFFLSLLFSLCVHTFTIVHIPRNSQETVDEFS